MSSAISRRIVSTQAPAQRDAARHFALKWQLGAEQVRDPKAREQRGLEQEVDWEDAGNELENIATELYTISEEDQAWNTALTTETSASVVRW